MRKRLLLLSSALCIIVLCVALAACTLLGGNNTNDNNTGKTEKTLQTVSVEVAGRYARYFSNGTITLPADVTAEFSKADFEVTGKYSDKSSETIRNYTIDVRDSGERSSTIEFSVDGQVMYTISVIKNPNILPALPTDDFEFEYNGEEMNVIQDPRFEGVLTAMLNSRVSLATGSVAVATDAGDYSFTLNATAGNIWKDGDAEMTSVTFNWRIKKKVVVLPTVVSTGSYVYDGNEKTLSLDMHGYGDLFTFVNGGSDTRKATNAGTYNCQVMLKTEYQKNYTFPGDHSSAEVMEVATWSIQPQKIAYPVLTDYKRMSEDEGVTYYHYAYTGSKIDITTNVDDCEVLTVTVNAGQDIVDVIPDSYYYVSVDFKTELSDEIGNYVWADNTSISGVSFYVKVDPIDYELPQTVQSATLYAEGDYSYSNGSYEFGLDGVALTSDTVALLGDVLVAGESTFGYADSKTYEVGTKTIKYSFKRSKNYNPLEVDISVTINKAKIETSDPTWYGTQNFGTYNYSNTDIGDYIYNGYEQKKEFQIFYWNGELIDQNLYATATYKVYYGTTEGVYGENPVMTSVVTAPDWGTYTFSCSMIANASNVGYYKTVVTLSIKGNNNYTFVNANGEEQTTYENTWQIKKATLTVYPHFSGTSQNTRGYSYYTNSNKTVVYDDTNSHIILTDGYSSAGNVNYSYPNASDYIVCDGLLNYIDRGGVTGWEETDYTKEEGHYKTVAQVSLKEGLSSSNYDIVVKEVDWYIYPNTFDLSGITWDTTGTYEYYMGGPAVIGIPDGLDVVYDPEDGGDLGQNTKKVTIKAFEGADGYGSVDIQKPTGWEYVDGHYYAITAVSYEYTVTKKIITINDFHLKLDDDSRVNDQNECVYDGKQHNAAIYCSENMSGFGFDIRYFNNCSQSEVGTYVLTGIIFIDKWHAAGDDRYSFDETDTVNVEELQEDYTVGDWTLRLDEICTDYKYILHFSITWAIVAE